MEEVTRRRFFGKAIAAIAGVIALGWGIPLLGCAFLPAFRSRRESWSEAGLVDRLEVDRPKELEIVLSLKNGWIDGAPRRIKSDMAIIIPAGARHNIKNTGGGPLKLYTLYAPPEHVAAPFMSPKPTRRPPKSISTERRRNSQAAI